jgi:hypothetical protein
MAAELLVPLNVSYSGDGVRSPLAQSLFVRRQVSAHNLAAGPPKGTSRISMGCTWDGCEFSFPSPEDLTNHLIEHSQEVLARWVRHSGCIWKGCKSKAIFKTTLAYGHHLRNIHSHPLVCNAPRCPHKKPFRNDADLDRHNRTAHLKEEKYECPYGSCAAETRTFARKDKWLKHIRETQHQNDAFCPFFHCSLKQRKTLEGFEDRNEIGEHFALHHSGDRESRYECGLGSCGGDLKHDFWSIEGLYGHLRHDHEFSCYPDLTSSVLKKERVFGIQQVRLFKEKYDWLSAMVFHDCKACAPENQPANGANKEVSA